MYVRCRIRMLGEVSLGRGNRADKKRFQDEKIGVELFLF